MKLSLKSQTRSSVLQSSRKYASEVFKQIGINNPVGQGHRYDMQSHNIRPDIPLISEVKSHKIKAVQLLTPQVKHNTQRPE